MRHLNFAYDNFEQFSHDIKGWNVDFKQLSNGSFDSYLQQVDNEDILITFASFSTKLEQRGSAPSNKWTFALLEATSPEIIWRGQNFSDQIAVYAPGSEIDAISPPGFKVITISISETVIECWRQIYENEGKRKLSFPRGLVSVEKDKLNKIRGIAKIFATKATPFSTIKKIEEHLVSELLNAICYSVPHSGRLARLNKFKTFKKLTIYIDEHLGSEVYLSALCKAGDISPRTVQRLFRHFIDDTPKSYIRARRLNNVKRDLFRNRHDTLISDIANKWGFWHLGQFAHDYHKLFGILPSETHHKFQT